MKEFFYYYLENYTAETIFVCVAIAIIISVIIVIMRKKIKDFFERIFH